MKIAVAAAVRFAFDDDFFFAPRAVALLHGVGHLLLGTFPVLLKISDVFNVFFL